MIPVKVKVKRCQACGELFNSSDIVELDQTKPKDGEWC